MYDPDIVLLAQIIVGGFIIFVFYGVWDWFVKDDEDDIDWEEVSKRGDYTEDNTP